VAIVLLGPLLGSSADASTAFTDHFADEGNRLRDLVGSLVWTVVAARAETSTRVDGPLRDLTSAVAVVTASVLVVASALLVTVPATTAIGELTDDPGIDPAVQAGIAQAGTVVLLVAALCLALTTLLIARLGRRSGAVPRWIVVTAWATAVTLALGVTVVLLVPFGAWAIAVGLVWTSEPR
jgi:hypothetical protein